MFSRKGHNFRVDNINFGSFIELREGPGDGLCGKKPVSDKGRGQTNFDKLLTSNFTRTLSKTFWPSFIVLIYVKLQLFLITFRPVMECP